MKGVVVDVRAAVVGDRLKVGARVNTPDEGVVDALLPDREVAAFLPRSLLLGARGEAPRSLLASLTPILRRFTVGREVRIWSHRAERYFAFPSWRSVRFRADDAQESPGSGAAPGPGGSQASLPEGDLSADGSTRPA